MTTRPKAFSYLRFSTAEQEKGDSLDRQLRLAQAYAARHGLDLDASLSYRDLGVSAFRGRNAETGRLAEFLAAVNEGLVPTGSYLLVESLDRISRQAARRAVQALGAICDAGVTLVTLVDEQTYTAQSLDDDPMKFMMSVLIFIRANEESATKSRRNREVWKKKRTEALSGKVATTVCPAWLTVDKVDESRTIRVIPERAKVVRRIFRETLRGIGQHAIAERLNVERVEPFGGGKYWHRSYIAKILANPSVVGTLVPHMLEYERHGTRRLRKPLEPIPDYYPAIITEDVFHRAQALIRETRAPLRGRHASIGEVFNFFGGLLRCGRCRGAVTVVNKGKPPKGARYVVCASAKTGAGCKYEAIRLERLEAAFLRESSYLLANVPAGVGGVDAEARLRNAESGLSETVESLRNLLRLAEKGRGSAALAERISELTVARDEAESQVRDLGELVASSSPGFLRRRTVELADLLSARPLRRTETNVVMRQVFAKCTVDFDARSLECEWKHGGLSAVHFEPFHVPPTPSPRTAKLAQPRARRNTR